MAYRLEINETNEPFGKVPGRDAFEVQMRLYDSGQYVNSVAAEISGQTVKALGGAASLIPALATVLLLEASPFVAQALGDRRLPLSDPSATFTVILPFEQIDRRLRSAPIDRTSVELVPLEVAPFLRVPSEPRRFGVRNFRSIGDERQSVELRPVTVLVGPNGSGKSNLFNALDALARLCRGHLVPPNWQHRLPTGAVQPTATLTFSWQVSDEGVSREFEYEVELGSRSYQDFIVRESLVEQPNGTVWIHTDGRTTRYRSALPATTDGTFADLQHPIPREHTAVRWLGDQRAFPASSSLRSLMEGFAIHEPWRGPSRNFHGDDRFLTGDGTNLPAVLRRLLRSGPIAKQLDEDLSHAVGEGSHLIDVDEANWQARISDVVFDAKDLSDGTQLWMHLMALLRDPNRVGPLAIDEPEIGLHPDLLHVFVREAAEVARADAPLLVATHSEGILDSLATYGLENVLLIVERESGATRIRPPDPETLRIWLQDSTLGEAWAAGAFGGNRW